MGITSSHGAPALCPSSAPEQELLSGLGLVEKGWMLAAPSFFSEEVQPQVCSYQGTRGHYTC